MARARVELQKILEDILGKRNVYFQSPGSQKMKYPCIVYERSDIRTRFANNAIYDTTKQYTVTVIDEDPDSKIPEKLLKLPYCGFDRHFVSDGLNHDVFTIFF